MSASAADVAARQAVAGIAKWWWLFIVTGVLWLVVSFIILQYDAASAATVGYIVGFMLVFTGIEQFFVASAAEGWKWVWILFGVLFLIGGVWAIFNPIGTAAALAQSLGILFGLIGIFWTIEAFATRSGNPLWWLTLISGLLMIGIAIWVGRQGFLERAITLLLFAGFWAIMHGIGDFIRAYELRKLGKLVKAA
jgi:uncharacterized membrane protein HdeD (DUF308 family)